MTIALLALLVLLAAGQSDHASGRAPLTVTFSPPTSDGALYQWQFDYNPLAPFAPDYSSEIGEDVTYTYVIPGAHTARLRVYDALTGKAADTDFSVTVLPPPAPPVVTLSFTPYPTRPGEVVSFTASAVPSPGRSILSWYWDFTSDGVQDAAGPAGLTASASCTDTTYVTPGPHICTVTAYDDGGLAGTASVEIRISANPNVWFSEPERCLAAVGVPLSITAAGYPCAPWSIENWAWDFGDGSTASGPSATVSHIWSAQGDYTVTATATDSAGYTNPGTIPVDVRAPPVILVKEILIDRIFVVWAYLSGGDSISSFGWDFNGDGVDDLTSPGGNTSRVGLPVLPAYAELLTVKAYRTSGLPPLTATTPIVLNYTKVDPPVAPIIQLAASADGGTPANTLEIRVGHVVDFSATGMPHHPLQQVIWDFDGDGEREQTDKFPSPDTATVQVSASYQYRSAGTFKARAKAIQTDGYSEDAIVTINVLPGAAPLECWIAQPRDGKKVWGNHVSLQARTGPAILTGKVEFQYRPAGSPGPWLPIGTAVPPPYTALSVSWNVTRLAPGPYEIRAVATDTSTPAGEALSTAIQTVTVTVDPEAPDEEEDDTGAAIVRTHGIDPNVATRSEIAQDTAIEFPPHAFMEYTTIRLERPFSNPHPLEARFQGLHFVPGSFRRLVLGGGAGLQKPSKIALYDINPGGILDDVKADKSKLRIFQFDDLTRQWVPLYGQVVQPAEDLARATLSSMGDVGLVMEPSPRAPSDAPSGACGLLGAEVLALALLLRPRSRGGRP